MTRLQKLHQYVNERGLQWTVLHVVRSICMNIPHDMSKPIHYLEKSMIEIEREKFLTGDSTISSLYHTVQMNRSMWNSFDWSRYGEEWTYDAQTYTGLEPNRWKESLINGMLYKYIEKDSIVLEIGPGAGRWTEFLQPIARRLLVADIAEKCLSICQERFRTCGNIEYYLINSRTLDFVPDNSIDYIWSYDVFVHINPTDTENYISEFQRILRPGGCAIIHHPDAHLFQEEEKTCWRSYTIDKKFFAHLVERYGFRLVEQNDALVHKPGDLISVFRKPK